MSYPTVTYTGMTGPIIVDVNEVRRLLIDQGVKEKEIRALRIRVLHRGLLSEYALGFLWRKTITLYTSYSDGIDRREAQDRLNSTLCHELKHYIDRHSLVDRLFFGLIVLEWILQNAVVFLLARKAVRRFGKKSLMLVLPLAYKGNTIVQQSIYTMHPAERRARAFQAQAQGYSLIHVPEEDESASR